jgi:hypothetical protein
MRMLLYSTKHRGNDKNEFPCTNQKYKVIRLNHELLEFMTLLKNKTKLQNSISKTEISVLEVFPYSKVAYKTLTSLVASPAADRTVIVLPN